MPFGRYSHAWHLRLEQGKCRTLLLYVAVSCGWSDAVLVTLCSMGPGIRPMSLQKMAAVHDVIHQITSMHMLSGVLRETHTAARI